MSDTQPIPHRRFGRLGYTVNSLGLGTAWIGRLPNATVEEGDDAAVAAIHRAIELGLDYLDTSPLYGESERRVGMALSQPHPEGGKWRDRVRLVTKAGTHPQHRGDYGADAIRWTVENSLKLLGTDYLDAVLVHDPPEIEPVLAPGGAIEALAKLKDEGMIGGTGIGVHGHHLLGPAILDGRFDIIQTTYDYSLLRTSALHLVPEAQERDLAVINASPYQSGLLAAGSLARMEAVESSRGWSSRPGDLERARALHRWADGAGVDLMALALQFGLRDDRFAVTLIGPKDASEVEQNIGTAQKVIPESAWQALEELLPTLPPPAPGGEAGPGYSFPLVRSTYR